jgi:PQQ system protein
MKGLLRSIGLAAFSILFASGCEYVKLLRPSVLKQLNPDVVRLVNELPRVDDQNEDIIGRLFAHGGLGHADLGRDGIMRANIRIPSGEYIWKPAIIVMDKPGELELDFYNLDQFSYHAVAITSMGDWQGLVLPINTRGRARVRFDQPGLYWFGCPVANHAQRGMLGLVMVRGETPAEAKLDRPKQRKP